MKKAKQLTPQQRLKIEFEAAIYAVLGENMKKKHYKVTSSDIDGIAKKVKFYMDLTTKEYKY